VGSSAGRRPGKKASSDLDVEKTFDEAAEVDGGHEAQLRLHLRPFFGKTPLSKINAGMGQDYRVHRMETGNRPRTGKHRKANSGICPLVINHESSGFRPGQGHDSAPTLTWQRPPYGSRLSALGISESDTKSTLTEIGGVMPNKSAIIIGASRGLGLAIVQELLERGWKVTGTCRQEAAPLRPLAEKFPGRLEIENVDITKPDEVSALKSRLAGRSFDLFFVNAGVANARYETVGEVSTDEFVRVLVTNSLSPMRVVEQFAGNVRAGGTIGVMSSGLGSVADNERGGFEVYRASKAALNTLLRSYAARKGKDHALLLLAPGWIKTDMGGEDATFTIEDVIHDIVDTITGQEGKTGLQYLDRFGKAVRW
jgi:NAD(P)-dependent dehydrogenase (short-subunit alcohol dehydrogenase family)